MKNPFNIPAEQYKRDLNIIDGALNDNARYISLMTNAPFEECLTFVRSKLKPGEPTGFKSPRAAILSKNRYGDRELTQGNFMGFLKRVERENLLLSPSMAAYMPETQRESTHSLYIKEGVENRSKVKKEMMAAKRLGNDEVALFKNGEQNNLKINNNSYSGATVSTATILHYKSTHSSLTSTCRTATSYANASNEKFIRGNRHYYTAEITRANLISIINLTDLDVVDRACQYFGLVYPSVEDVMELIVNNTKYYWRQPSEMEKIRALVSNTLPVHRAAFMYIGDLYHIYKLNPEFTRTFLERLAEKGTAEDTLTDAEYGAIDGDTKMLANFLCYNEVKGRDTKMLLEGVADKGIKPEPEVYDLVKGTAKHVYVTLEAYELFFQAFFLTCNMPSSIHEFPSIHRKAVPISDTDSTMFTLVWWVEEFYGKVAFHEQATRLVMAMVFLISQVVMHILALLSANMGVSADKLRKLSMKNEYYFAVLNLTTRSKHYYASQDAQEGLMFPKPKMEVKGVGLRDSKVPPKLQKAAKALMEEIIATIKAGELIDLYAILRRIGDMERDVIASLTSGSPEYLTTGQVKAKESYKEKEDNATYKQWLLWQEVFMPEYGAVQEPPYGAVKVSLNINNKTDLDRWCQEMHNDRIAMRLKKWFMQEERKDLSTLLIPMTVVETLGIPKEIIYAIDTRRIISNVMGTFYLMLESLGIFLIEKNNIRLVSDYY